MLGEWELSSTLKWHVSNTSQETNHHWVPTGFLSLDYGTRTGASWALVICLVMMYSGLYKPFVFISKHFLISILQKPFGFWLFYPLMFKWSLGSATVPVMEASRIPSDVPSFLSSMAHMEVGWLIHPGDGYYRRIFREQWSRLNFCGLARPTYM